MKLIFKIVLVLAVVFAAFCLYPKYRKWADLQERLARADETIKRQEFLTNEKRARLAALPSIDPDASERESQARWEAAKLRGSLPEQDASISGQGTNSRRTR